MTLSDIALDLGALTIPVFAAIFGAGWTACRLYLVKPLEKRVTHLEAQDEAYRREKDEELRALRQLIQRVPG